MAADLVERRHLGFDRRRIGAVSVNVTRSPTDLLPSICASLHERGATWLRASFTENHELIVEGWYVRPDEEGPVPE